MTDTIRNNLTIYDDVASQWWSDDIRWVRTLRNMVPARLRYFDKLIDWRGKEVLDLGCAGGFMTEALDDRGAQVTGIDPAKDAIAAARTHAQGRNITYDVGVGEALPYIDEKFDAIVCVDVLEHVSDLSKVLAEVHRVLKPGGLFFFDTINRSALAGFAVVTIVEDVLRLLPKGTHDPAMFIKPSELKVELQAAGLGLQHLTGLGPVGMNRRFDLKFGQLPLKTIIFMGHATKGGGESAI